MIGSIGLCRRNNLGFVVWKWVVSKRYINSLQLCVAKRHPQCIMKTLSEEEENIYSTLSHHNQLGCNGLQQVEVNKLGTNYVRQCFKKSCRVLLRLPHSYFICDFMKRNTLDIYLLILVLLTCSQGHQQATKYCPFVTASDRCWWKESKKCE